MAEITAAAEVFLNIRRFLRCELRREIVEGKRARGSPIWCFFDAAKGGGSVLEMPAADESDLPGFLDEKMGKMAAFAGGAVLLPADSHRV